MGTSGHFLILYANGELRHEWGARTHNDITQNPLLRTDITYRVSNTQLSNREFNRVIRLANRVHRQNLGTDIPVVLGAWGIQIYYRGRATRQLFSVAFPSSQEVQDLFELIVELAPREIRLHALS